MTNAVSIAQLGANNSSFTNRIINGQMVLDQRNAGASVTPADQQYTLDRWVYIADQASKCTIEQTISGVSAPAGFSDYLGVTSTAATTITTSQVFGVVQRIEGYNMADFAWGTASAATVTLSFWVRSSLTGTFGGGIQNDSQDRSYPFSYTISSANTWEQKTITIVGDTSGTWLTTNGMGIKVTWGLGVGSTFSGTAGAWNSNNNFSATGATSVVGTNGATFYITGVQLEVGSTATSFDYRPYGTELQLCQRYYAKLTYDGTGGEVLLGTGLQSSTTDSWVYTKYPVTMRTEPTASISSLQVSNFRSFASDATLQAIYAGYDAGTIRCSMTASGAADAAILLQIKNNTAGFLALSAEL